MSYPRVDLASITTDMIVCPRQCGWHRIWTVSKERTIIDHPLYGPVTTIELVGLDVRSHDCTEHHNALVRLRRARNGSNQGTRTSS